VDSPAELIDKSRELLDLAAQIQDETAQLNEQARQQKLSHLKDLYTEWYHQALGLFPHFNRLDLQQAFMKEYEGGLLSQKIKQFLSLGWKVYEFYDPEKPNPFIPKWTASFDRSFREPLEKQCSLLAALGTVPMDSTLIGRQEQDTLASQTLRQILTDRFNDTELSNLCFDSGIDYDTLKGDSKADKARELVAHFKRRNSEATLVEAVKRIRPDIIIE
jgi:hypothetical protein